MNTCDGKPVVVGDEFAMRDGREWLTGNVIRVTKTLALFQVRYKNGYVDDVRFRLRDFFRTGDHLNGKSVWRVDDELRKDWEQEKQEREFNEIDAAFRRLAEWCSPVRKLGRELVEDLIRKMQDS